MVKRNVCIFLVALLVLFAMSCSKTQDEEMTLGLGQAPLFRIGPGRDSTETRVYSFTYTQAAVFFDAEGRIVDLEVDALEVSTPNYDGHSMPHFSGWPGSPEPNFTDHDAEEVKGTAPTTEESIASEVNGWQTKRDRGDDYGMNERDWWKQMDSWEDLFIGKTVDEMDVFYATYTAERNGRVLNPEASNEADKAEYDALSADDKKIVADVRTGATMSINDAHGHVPAAIRDAWNKRKPVGSTTD